MFSSFSFLGCKCFACFQLLFFFCVSYSFFFPIFFIQQFCFVFCFSYHTATFPLQNKYAKNYNYPYRTLVEVSSCGSTVLAFLIMARGIRPPDVSIASFSLSNLRYSYAVIQQQQHDKLCEHSNKTNTTNHTYHGSHLASRVVTLRAIAALHRYQHGSINTSPA